MTVEPAAVTVSSSLDRSTVSDADDQLASRRAAASFGRAKGLLVAIDAGVVLLSGILAKVLYLDLIVATGQPLLPYILASLTLSIVFVLFSERMRAYNIDTVSSLLVGFGRVWGTLALSFLVTLGLMYTIKVAEDFSRVWFFAWFGLAAVALVFGRSRCLSWLREKVRCGEIRHRVALVGTPEYMQGIENHLMMSCPLSEVGGKYAVDGSAPLTDGLQDLQIDLTNDRFDQVIICIPANERDLLIKTTRRLGSYCAELLLCTDLTEYPVAVSGSRAIGSVRLDVVNVVPPSEQLQFLKVLLDRTLASIGLLLLAPLLLVVAIAIKLDSTGPVFFIQRRYGQNNKVFGIIKFRTMTVAEDGAIVRQAQRDDVRVTRVGRILRRTSIDELPQLINVLLGHMSIVGPRPHAIAHDDVFERELDLFSRRRRVRPGITGWAQIHGHRGETPTTEAVRRRMEHDLYYIDNWSIWLDLEIIARTLFVIGRGAY